MCFCIFKVFSMPAARVSPATTNQQNGHRKSLHDSRESSSSECPSLQDAPALADALADAAADATDEEEIDVDVYTPYQKALKKLQSDEKWQREISLGRRIGLYRIKEELGSGNFSQVRAGVHSLTKERVAVKILDKAKLDAKTQKMLDSEIASMESLHHPNVIRLYEVLETLSKIYLVMEHASGGELFHRITQNGPFTERGAKQIFSQILAAVDHMVLETLTKIYLVMEHASGGELFHRITQNRPFTERGAKQIFSQIIAAVDHMHLHNVIHRDLKAENVFFAGPNLVKVGDFGFSTHIEDFNEPLKTFCGSPPYAAPELFRDDSYIGAMVDIWALGVLLYFMLTATMPFKAQTVSGLKKQILEGEFPMPEYLSKECQFLFTGILKLDPKSRITLEQIKKSDWLMGKTFPSALPRDNIHAPSEIACNENGPSLSAAEKSARDKLLEFGITVEMVEEAKSKGSRSSVIGTYRIVLHKFFTEKTPFIYEEKKPPPNDYQFLKREEPPKKFKLHKPRKNKKSKLCTIL